MSSPSILDTAEYRKLALIAAGVDPSNIPAILDTATWRHLMLAALYAISSGGGGGGYISGVVDTYNDLPVTVGTPALNTVYLVRFASGIWLINRKPGGLYIRIANFGTLDDWEYLSAFPEVQSDLRWRVYNETDPTKEVALDVSNVSTGTLRTLGVPNASGRIQIEGQPIGNTTPAAGTFTTLAANNGTLTASAPVLDLAQTWNNAAVAFTGIRANFTDTASAAASKAFDLQVGGTSVLETSRIGLTVVRRLGASTFANAFEVRRDSTLLLSVRDDGSVNAPAGSINTGTNISLSNNGVRLRADFSINWSSTGSTNDASDTFLVRDGAADTLAQRRGANAQTFRLYNTFTDASNHERGFMRWSSNVLQIGTEKAGTGSARALEFQTDGVTRLGISTGGTVGFGQQTGQSTALIGWSGNCFMRPVNASAGVLTLLNAALNGFNRLQFGGTDANFPALKRDSTALQVRLADDSAFAPFASGNLTVSNTNDFTVTANSTSALMGGAATIQLNGVRLSFLTGGTERVGISGGGDLFLAGGTDLSLSTITGTQIGTATNQLLGFYGATPVDRPATVADPTGGGTIDAEARTAINEIIDRLQELGLIA